MKLEINSSFYISDLELSDQPALVKYLQEKQIYDQTLAIPYPYTEVDAEWWINHNLEATRAQGGRSVNWAIRRADGEVIGAVGFLNLKIGQDHQSELGYWLAKPYWGQGLMTEVVRKVVAYAFREFGLARIAAHVFDFNVGSARVLEKAGFQFEGILRSHYKKDGRIFDGRLYAILRENPSSPPSPRLTTPRLTIRLAEAEDIPGILEYFKMNEAHFSRFSPPNKEASHTERYWRERVNAQREEFKSGRALRFSVFNSKMNSEVVGAVELSHIVRGPFQAGYLGYAISQPYEGTGMMSEAVRAVLKFAFEEIKLHRIMANHRPENLRSERLLERLGFVREGVAKEYLFIGGAWRDHVLNSLTNPNWRPE